jgi:type IX secretion system PorP/SprF family membrane protein
MRMKKLILGSLLTLISFTLTAQQDAMISQYMFNGLFLNPGYAGTHPYLSTTALHRTQWVNFEGAPQTSSFAIDGPVQKDKMGLGLLIVNDRIGVTQQTDIYANYSYKVKVANGHLAFGLKAGASAYSARLSELTVWEEDETFAGNRSSHWLPKFGFGTYFYSEKAYAGISIPTLVAYDPGKDFKFDIEASTHLRRHYFFNAGYVLNVNPIMKLKPSVLVKYVSAAPTQVEFNMNALLYDVLWIGASYRTGDAIAAIGEYQITPRLRVGYTYDFTTSIMNKYSNGTHEIVIGYDFRSEKIKMKNPRYF